MDPIAELRRRLDNLLRLGTIYAVDHAGARCRVQSGALLTDWLPWYAHRAGALRHWSPPSTGEQCVIFSPCGELAAGFVLVGFNSDFFAAPSETETQHSSHFVDGAVISYDYATHALTAVLPAGGSALLTAPAGVQINGDVSINGALAVSNGATVTGTVAASVEVTAAGISLTQHVHGNVQGGSSTSGGPQ